MSLRKVTLSGLLAPSSSPSCITKRQKGEREREKEETFAREKFHPERTPRKEKIFDVWDRRR